MRRPLLVGRVERLTVASTNGFCSSKPSQFWSIPSPGTSVAAGLIAGLASLQSNAATVPSWSASTGIGMSRRREYSQPVTVSVGSTCASSSRLAPQSTRSASLSKAASESSPPSPKS